MLDNSIGVFYPTGTVNSQQDPVYSSTSSTGLLYVGKTPSTRHMRCIQSDIHWNWDSCTLRIPSSQWLLLGSYSEGMTFRMVEMVSCMQMMEDMTMTLKQELVGEGKVMRLLRMMELRMGTRLAVPRR